MIIVLLGLIILFGGIFGFDFVRSQMIQHYFKTFTPPPITVSTTSVEQQHWYPSINAIGTLTAINGGSVSSQQPGAIREIHFQSGQFVQAGDVLVVLDDRLNQQDLKSNQAALTLARLNYERFSQLYKQNVAAKAKLDEELAALKESEASAIKTQIVIDQKHVKAPFTGKIGIREVNLGQYIQAGQSLVTLQALDPLYVNFSLPEQYLPVVRVGQQVSLQVDGYPQQSFEAYVTAINATSDAKTHNVALQATISNKDFKLYPGLFAQLKLWLLEQQSVLVVPQTAVTYSLYGDVVYVLTKTDTQENNQPVYTANQRVVITGAHQKDKVAITQGLKAGETIVIAGQLKLSNGARVVINNAVP